MQISLDSGIFPKRQEEQKQSKIIQFNTWNVLVKTHAIVCIYNVTSPQYLAKNLFPYYLCCAARSIQLKYTRILAKRLTFKLFKFIDSRQRNSFIKSRALYL